MPHIEKRQTKSGTKYRAYVRLKGIRKKSATFDSPRAARKWADEMEAKLKVERNQVANSREIKTVREAIDRYLLELTIEKPRYYEDKKRRLGVWRRMLGDLPVTELTPLVLVKARQKLRLRKLKNGNPVAPATVNRYLAVLSHVLTTAEKEWGWIYSNPMSKVSRLTEPRGRVRFLNSIERIQLLEACKVSRNQFLYTIIVLAISTGMRRSEILNLRWADVDLDRSRCILHETKNGERRAVPIVGHAKDLLIELFKSRGTSRLVFPSARDKPFHDLKNSWGGAIKRSGISDFRFHDLRHCTASYLAMNGATSHEIAEVRGHKSLDMVKRYAHLCESHVAKVVEKMTHSIF